MIQLKELITENILYNCSWEYKDDKYHLCLTKDNLYVYICNRDSYSYSIYPVKNFGKLFVRPMSYRPPNYSDCAAHGCLNITSKQEYYECMVELHFPCSEEGAKVAEELFVAISKVMN